MLNLLIPLALALAEWPASTPEVRPWTYWWWQGSAVDTANLTREMERYRAAGLGGVHIIPIYGARGAEDRYIEYLSPKWMAMLKHAVQEGRRLGLGVDMTTGTGWCFGGPNITAELASAVAVPHGDSVGMKPAARVKRAAPGGEGYMLNPFYAPAMRTYLERFTKAFDGYDGPLPRAMYHDSFEYGANWSPDLPQEFERRRGYALPVPLLFGAGRDDRTARTKSDYRETLSDTLLENFTRPWVAWCRQRGILTRNEAHGSPANLLDLYAEADIPETEMFNRDRSTVVSKFASSAAHVTGRKLVACETGTWLKEHFTERLADLKDLLDQVFLAGVNHVVYHGTCYSPDNAAWPGWLFYASTQMNPRNSIWHDAGALNAYIARAQTMLQAGRPATDFLLYWPVYDVWHNAEGLAQNFTVHRRQWVEGTVFGKLAESLLERGYQFDFVSDRQLEKVAGGVIVVPACDHMPVATLARLFALARNGAQVIFQDHLPADVPGWANLERRRAEFRKLVAEQPAVRVGDVEAGLAAAGVRREALAPGLQAIRRVTPEGAVYFIANRGAAPVEGFVPLAMPFRAAVLLDPMTGRTGRASSKGNAVYLQLEPGQSILVQAVKASKAPVWEYWRVAGGGTKLAGAWEVRFIEGGPELPAPLRMAQPGSWAEAAPAFSGTAVYATTFDSPGRGEWYLDLGQVCESARVRLNGASLGTVFMAPFRVKLGALRPKDNRLEVEVTNLPANRIRDLDRRKVPWKIFHDINIVNLDYKPFDASGWPLRDSGLLGPVTLRAATRLEPR